MKMYGITAVVRRFLEIKYRMMKLCWKIENDDVKLISWILTILIERFRLLVYNKARVWS